jgi:DNA polymerase III subunit epsilon
MRQLVCFDLETTGLDPLHDRIISLGIVSICPLTWSVGRPIEYMFNPQIPIPAESTKIHGITNEQVIHCPSFQELANVIFDHLKGKDLAGFNLLGLDLPILWAEFDRCGIKWEPLKNHILDAGVLFKKREERTLSAAVKFYLNRSHDSAHSAGGDALATAEVLVEQVKRYKLANRSIAEIEPETIYDRPMDVAGKIVLKDGVPTYAFGQKTKGKPVVSDLGFANWMMGKDFHPDTLRIVQEVVELYLESQGVDSLGDWNEFDPEPFHAELAGGVS